MAAQLGKGIGGWLKGEYSSAGPGLLAENLGVEPLVRANILRHVARLQRGKNGLMKFLFIIAMGQQPVVNPLEAQAPSNRTGPDKHLVHNFRAYRNPKPILKLILRPIAFRTAFLNWRTSKQIWRVL